MPCGLVTGTSWSPCLFRMTYPLSLTAVLLLVADLPRVPLGDFGLLPLFGLAIGGLAKYPCDDQCSMLATPKLGLETGGGGRRCCCCCCCCCWKLLSWCQVWFRSLLAFGDPYSWSPAIAAPGFGIKFGCECCWRCCWGCAIWWLRLSPV